MSALRVICPGLGQECRCRETLSAALEGEPVRYTRRLTRPLQNERLLFVVTLEETGLSRPYYSLLGFLRSHPDCLAGCTAGIVVDGRGDLYTKSTARELALAISAAGCTLVGRPLVEATGSLRNFTVQAKNASCSLKEAYVIAVRDLARRVASFSPPRAARPKLAVLHASSHRTSNTMALWSHLREQLSPCCDIREIALRNGTLEDCAGCPYTMCLHFGEKGSCFYGGVMVQEVYPALRGADCVVLLCPNYNDALSANLTACINRLTALYRTTPFTGKAVYAVAVSGYSGGDIIAQQLISALGMNKGFYLPPRFCLMETANDAGTAIHLPGIEERLREFAGRIRRQLCAAESTSHTVPLQ